MKKPLYKIILTLTIVGLILVAFNFASSFTNPKKPPATSEIPEEIATANEEIEEEKLEETNVGVNSPEEILAQMTLEDKIGQMFMVGFWGTEPDYYINKMIDERHIGGVILMKYNIQDRQQLIDLTEALQLKSSLTPHKIPLLIATDQEGGLVLRVKVDGATEFTSQKNLTDQAHALSVGQKRGLELKQVGINVNFAPVLDYITDSSSFIWPRTFQKDLKETGILASALIEGYQESIIASPKHFLGHPDSSIDPHRNEVHADFSEAELLERAELFEEVFKASLPGMVMTSHVIYDEIDPKHPCTLSAICIQEWLKQKAGFASAVIITDDIEMDAIQNTYTNAEAAVMAVKAGNDILLYVTQPEHQAEAYNAVIEAVKSGEVPMEHIDESVLKILKLKEKYI